MISNQISKYNILLYCVVYTQLKLKTRLYGYNLVFRHTAAAHDLALMEISSNFTQLGLNSYQNTGRGGQAGRLSISHVIFASYFPAPLLLDKTDE